MSEVAEKPKAADKRAVILNPQRMGLREEKRQDWVVNAEAGTTIQDVLDPQYWSHMAAQMLPYARIEVLLETGEWMLDLVVLNAGRNWAQVHVLHRYELAERSETMPAATKHLIDWKGDQLKYCVIRVADNEIIHKGLASKAKAVEWLTSYEKSIG